MLLSQFCNDVLDFMEALPRDTYPEFFVCIESGFAFRKLKSLLQESATIEKEIEWSDVNVFLFISSVSLRGEALEKLNTVNAIYPHSAMTRANQAYYFLLNKLSQLNLAHEFHPYHYLMPSLRIKHWAEITKEICLLKPDRFIFSEPDSDGRVINLQACFDQAYADRTTKLTHTYGARSELTEGERKRVIEHSRWSRCYYDLVYYHAKHPEHNNDTRQFMNDAEFDNEALDILYDKKISESILKKYICELSGQKFSGLVDFIFNYVERENWHPFLNAIDKIDLCVVNREDLLQILHNQHNYTESERDRVVLLVLSEAYKRFLEDRQEDYKSTTASVVNSGAKFFGSYVQGFASYTKSLIGGHSKAEKDEAVGVFQDFLVSGYALNEFMTYVDDVKKTHCIGALTTGDLNALVTQASKCVSKPSLRPKK